MIWYDLPLQAETLLLLRSNWVNTMAADALCPRVARSWAGMVLIMHDKWVLFFHKEGFQESVPS